MTIGHALLFGARRPECGFPPSAFECLGAAKPLLHNSRPAVGNLRATHRALILLLLAPNHNRLCWVVILFWCRLTATAPFSQLPSMWAQSPLCGRVFLFLQQKRRHLMIPCSSSPNLSHLHWVAVRAARRGRGLINDRTPPPWGGVRSSHFSRVRDLTLTPRTS